MQCPKEDLHSRLHVKFAMAKSNQLWQGLGTLPQPAMDLNVGNKERSSTEVEGALLCMAGVGWLLCQMSNVKCAAFIVHASFWRHISNLCQMSINVTFFEQLSNAAHLFKCVQE